MSEYQLFGDYHTHTTYSHGKGSVRDNIVRAKELGLKQIAISDHSLKHIVFGLTEKKIINQLNDIENCRKEFPDIDILFGVESNLIGSEGVIDIPKDRQKEFNIILCGFHKPVRPDKLSDLKKIYMNSYFCGIFPPTKSVLKRHTHALIEAVKNNTIDVLAHINYSLKVNCGEVAKACADYGTFIELSSRHLVTTDKDIEDMLKTDVKFILNSDAHKVSNIGNCSMAWEIIKKFNISYDRIVNLNGNIPKFRSGYNDKYFKN